MADLYTQFEGEEIAGKRYKLGEAISRDDVDAGIVRYLIDNGRLSDQPPAIEGNVIPVMGETALNEMTRAELETTARNTLDLSEYTDEELREGIEKRRNEARGVPTVEADEPAPFDANAVIEGSVADMKPRLDAVTDPAQLAQAREAEVAGRNRDSALAAIDARVSALNG